MADQFQPTFPALPKPFGDKTEDKTYHTFRFGGVPQGTRLIILNENRSQNGRAENGVLVQPWDPGKLWISIFETDLNLTKGAASNTVNFLAEYPDGSSETFYHTFTVHPFQRYYSKPTVNENQVQAGVETPLRLNGMPRGAQLSIRSAPQGWAAVHSGDTLRVTADSPGTATLYGLVSYSDGSSQPVSFTLTATSEAMPAPTVTTRPTQPAQATTIFRPPAIETTTVTLPVTETRITTVASPVTTTTTVTQSVPTTIREPVPTTVDRTLTVTEQPPTVTATHQITSTQTHTQVSTSVIEPAPTTVKETVTEPVSVTQMSTSTVTQPVTVTQTATATQTTTATAAPTTVTVTKTAAPEPTAGSSGSSTGGLIAVVVGVLAVIGGIAAFLVNQIPGLSNLLPI